MHNKKDTLQWLVNINILNMLFSVAHSNIKVTLNIYIYIYFKCLIYQLDILLIKLMNEYQLYLIQRKQLIGNNYNSNSTIDSILGKITRLYQIDLLGEFKKINFYVMQLRNSINVLPVLYNFSSNYLKLVLYKYATHVTSNNKLMKNFLISIPIELRYLFSAKNKSFLLPQFR